MREALLGRLALSLLVLVAAWAGLAPGAAADEAQTYAVVAGGPPNEEATVISQAFLPETLTINAGDRITWSIEGFHTVTFLAGQARPPLFVPDPSDPGRRLFNPSASLPSGGTSFDGTALANSGIPFLAQDPNAPQPPGPPTYTLTFPSAGTFPYVCLVHPDMVGTVIVQPGGARPMTPAQATAASNQVLEARLGAVTARLAQAQAFPTRAVLAGVRVDAAEALVFAPSSLAVNEGDSVTWTTDTQDPHSVTFLAGGPELENGGIEVEPQPSGPPALALSRRLLAPTDGGSTDGSGFVNSGLLWASGSTQGVPSAVSRFTLTFTRPGTYAYYCVVHGPAMSGTIIVQAASGAPALESPAVQAPAPQVP